MRAFSLYIGIVLAIRGIRYTFEHHNMPMSILFKSITGVGLCFITLLSCNSQEAQQPAAADSLTKKEAVIDSSMLMPVLDTALYDQKIIQLANGDSSGRWPVKTAYPNAGAILPYKRIIAYYGNFYSKNMGILGQYPQDQVIEKLKAELKSWNEADSTTPAIPAIHYIAVTAQGSAGKDGKYRARMPFAQIDKAIEMAKLVDGIVFIDIQVALSTLEKEIPLLKEYLKLPQVHLGIDPEFSMKTGAKPGTVIGTMDAADINYASEYLASLVKEFNLPPKILIVHRFTNGMMTNYKKIRTSPEVQIIIHMDGFGSQQLKKNSYNGTVYREPVQFSGLKLFYKNDNAGGAKIMTPKEILKLKPQPVYIQYQ
jgi:hypothetical protein